MLAAFEKKHRDQIKVVGIHCQNDTAEAVTALCRSKGVEFPVVQGNGYSKSGNGADDDRRKACKRQFRETVKVLASVRPSARLVEELILPHLPHVGRPVHSDAPRLWNLREADPLANGGVAGATQENALRH